jgi:excisionase family DNA binding protein
MGSWLSVGEVSKLLGVSERSVRRWAAEGTLRSVRLRWQYRFEAAVVQEALTKGLPNEV